jgi:hypothetical protein
MSQEPSYRNNGLLRWAIWTAGAIALAYLIVEHRPHLLGWIPYLILLACPLMHLFMHGGRSHQDGGHSQHDEASHKH